MLMFVPQSFDVGAAIQISHQRRKNPIVFKIQAGLSRALDLNNGVKASGETCLQMRAALGQ